MSSTPLRKRRQSIRSPQRRLQGSKNPHETSFDPFLSTVESEDATILKQTLLAQLNARVSADNSNPFVFGQSTGKDDGLGTKRYDGKHDKIFKSMKSIAALRISDNLGPSMSRSQSKQDLSKTGSLASTSVKRADLGDHPVATPSKRRKIESVKPSPSALPKLSFNFDKARAPQQQSTASITTAMSKLSTPSIQKSPARQGIFKSPSRANLTTDGGSSARPQQGHLATTALRTTVTSVTSSALPLPLPSSYSAPCGPDQKRLQKRQEQRKKGTVQRMLAKTALPRPGWK
ncbi:protein of unknown function [Taphrina deformans PYCC 5710]|uniref:Uncharacterized protein n=1 Tax=Taphrina deformans (strain PYCC 5710 / ATCC 11124 / CBS 356.35 / IMI 108563 / JCM 9778 / NBRC 8474) TaxID=1097556 RepID=R4XKV2_TAPDE|nr:protein of unknown function [Taphrina deformans PYCC 5710]|eukprot:CCG83944.1 protein of unknown function [Taphrina deformans PYCC 5710]